jgi:hypothetical protein
MAPALWSASGENPGEGSNGEEEVYINEEDIIHEVTIDDEGAFLLLPVQAPFISFACCFGENGFLLITACPIQISPTAMRMRMTATGWVRWRASFFFLDL